MEHNYPRPKWEHVVQNLTTFLDPQTFWLMAADTSTFTVVCQEHTQMLVTRIYSSEKSQVFSHPAKQS